MRKSRIIYTIYQRISAVCMVIALTWLTVSTPFIFRAQQEQLKIEKNTGISNNEEEAANPFSNTTEEKAPTNTISEYLHEAGTLAHPTITLAKHHTSHIFDCYVAFHGELLSPPPEA